MADYRNCLSALARAAGRELTDDEVQAVFERVHKAALDIKAGRVAPEDVTLGAGLKTRELSAVAGQAGDNIISQAAQRAAAELEAQASKIEQQAYLQLVKTGARMRDVENLEASGLKPLDAVNGLIARDYSSRTNIESLEQRVFGHQSNFLRKLLPTWEALGKDFLGFFQDRMKMLDLIRELRGEDTGNPLARQGAKAFHDVAEEARQVFNANGGAVGKLDDWGMPQHHSQEKVAKVGQEPWVDQILPYMDRTRYVDEYTDIQWTDAEMREFLGHAWETIATNGNNKIIPGEFRGPGKRANRHAEHRQIHFKDAESQIAYWEAFGERTLVEILHDHVSTMARDVAFIESFGPNPNVAYQTLRDDALQRATVDNPKDTPKLESRAVALDNLYDYASGKRKPVYRPWLKQTADAIAGLNVGGKLGSSMFTSLFGDKVMLEAVSHMDNLPALQRWRNEVNLLNPVNEADRRMLQRQGLMLDAVRSGLQRFGDDLSTSGTPGRIANAVMRLTGMQGVNSFRQGAFALTLMDSIGHELQSGRGFADLADSDIRALRTFGVNEADWNTWKLAQLDDLGKGNVHVLTPESISRIPDDALRQANVIGQADDSTAAETARRNAIVKLLGAVNTESEFAIVTPGWKERALFFGNVQRGTVPGEIWRSVLQFKTFPWTFFERAMDAVANQDTPVSKAAMTAYIIAGTTLAGAMIVQTKEMLAGKDPRKMADENWYKFWASAFVNGGALGFYGDFIYSVNQTRYGSGPIEALSGPTLGPLLELSLVQPLNAIRKSIEGQETHLASQTIADLKGYVPFNNAWYAKAAIDHLVWQQVMESLNPGYLNSIRRKTQKEYDQGWWWDLGETQPSRFPNLGEALAR